MRMRLRLFLKAIQGTLFDHPLSHLVPTQKVVNRKGKTHLQTYFVNPAKHAPKAKKQDARALLPAKEVRGEQMGLPLEPTPAAEPPQPTPAPAAPSATPPSPAPQRGEEPGYMSAEKKRALAESARAQFGNFSVQGSDIPYDAALAAHNGTSWSPEHRAHLHQREWVEHFSGLIDRLAPLAKTEEQRQALEQMLAEHARRRKEKVLDYLAAKSRVASPMIAGPANFPFESNQRRIEAEMRKLNELSEFDERAEKAMRKRLTEMGEPPLSEVQRYERKLAHLERLQEMMKNLNAAIRRAGGKATPELEAEFARYGLSSADMHKRLTPDFAGRIGFHDYELKNNGAEIRRVRGLLEAARAKEAMAAQQSQSGGPQPRTVKGVQVVEDAGQDRLRLIFPGKPAPEVIARLKARGFRWSPSNKAWQRQLTNAARQAAEEILAGLPGEEPPEPKEEQGQPPAPRPKVQPEHLEEARKLLRQGKLKIGDRYRDVGLKKEHKGFTSRGEEIWGYPYSPEHFIPSDATGKPLRYYVTLPNGAVVHPDELERLRYNPSTGRYEMPSDEGLFVVYPDGEKLRRKNAASAISDAGINRFPSDTPITVHNSSGLSVTLPKSEWFKLATGPFHAANENAPTFVDWAEQSGLAQQGGAAPEADAPPSPPDLPLGSKVYSDTAGVAGPITGQGTLGQAPAYEVTTASGDKRVIPADQAIPYGQGPDTRDLSPEEARLIESGRLRVGDTKTVFGVTYRLNENHRWERVDEEAPLDPEAAYRQQVFQAAQRALEAGKKLGVRTHLRYWPLDRPEQLAFRNGQLYLIDRGQAVAITGLTLDDLAGQVGVSRPKRDEGPDPAIEAESQRQAEAQADKRWRDFVDKRFGGDEEAALAAYEENNRQRVMADQGPLSLDEFVQQAAAPGPSPADSPWERLGAVHQDGFILLKGGGESTYNHRKRIEVGSVYPSGARDPFTPKIELEVEGQPQYENGKKSSPKASDLAWAVVCVLPSGQRLRVTPLSTRKEALSKAERLLHNPKLLVGKLESVLAKDFPEDHQRLTKEGMFSPLAPASPPAPEPASPANSGEYRDVGEKIGGARKDLAALQARAKEEGFRLSLADLETLEQDPAIARRLLTRDNLVGKPLEFAAELQANSSAGAGFMATKILSRVESSPADSPQARRAFALGLQRLSEALRGAKDVQGLKGAMQELAAEYNGFYLPPELKEEYERLKAARAAALEKYNQHRREVVNPAYDAAMKAKGAEREAATLTWQQALAESRRLEAQCLAASEALAALEKPLREREQADPFSRRNVLAALGDKFLKYIRAQYNPNTAETYQKDLQQAAQLEQQNNWEFLGKTRKAPSQAKGKPTLRPWERLVPESYERSGQNLPQFDSETLLKTFGLRAVEYGNWMDYEASKLHTQAAGAALFDLATVLGIPHTQTTLNGRLALAFGARGKGAAGRVVAAAHYEPARKVINLTKFAGGGSLAHEWGHFLDNVTSMLSYGGSGGDSTYVSRGEAQLSGMDPEVQEAFSGVLRAVREGDYIPPVRIEVPKTQKWAYLDIRDKFKAGASREELVGMLEQEYRAKVQRVREYYASWGERKLKEELNKAAKYSRDRAKYLAYLTQAPVEIHLGEPGSHYYHTAKAHGEYYVDPAELFARAFEAYVSDQLDSRGMKNTYLVAGASERAAEAYAQVYGPELVERGLFDGNHSMYPRGEERRRINAAMDRLIHTLREKGIFLKAVRLLGKRLVFRRGSR